MADQARLLVVDDDVSVAVTLQAVLERDGYRVWAAKSKAEAVSLIEANEFDVAVVDLRLCGDDGLGILELFRCQQPDCMTIMLTGYDSLESAVEAIRLGAYDYLIKPCDLEEFKLTVRGAVERSAAARGFRMLLEEQGAELRRLRSLVQGLRQNLEDVTAELELRTRELAQVKRQIQQPQYKLGSLS